MAAISRILSFDTALFGCAVAYYDSARDLMVTEHEAMARGQAEKLVPMIQDVLDQAGADFQDIHMICTTTGPGAFTGLRIGLSTARTLALALDVPLTGLTTLAVLARQFFDSRTLTAKQILGVLIETKRRDFYYQLFDRKGAPLTAPEAADIERINARCAEYIADKSDIVMIGDALARFSESGGAGQVQGGYETPDPALMIHMALEGQGCENPEPVYLRGADVSQPKKAARKIKEE